MSAGLRTTTEASKLDSAFTFIIEARIPSAKVTVVPSYVSAPMPTVEPIALIT